jgi:hypothetical protein
VLFRIHVLTATVMEMLEKGARRFPTRWPIWRGIAVPGAGRRRAQVRPRARYGLLVAQLALALNGQDRAQVLSQMLELLADRELRAAAGEAASEPAHRRITASGEGATARSTPCADLPLEGLLASARR